MRPLVIFLNERSHDVPDGSVINSIEWERNAASFFSGIFDASEIRPELKLGVPHGRWHGLLQGKPFSSWVSDWLGRDRYRKLLGKIQQLNPDQLQYLEEVRCQERPGVGMSLAFLSESWVASFPATDSPWTEEIIPGIHYSIHEGGDTSVECNVKNISKDLHVSHWKDYLRDWGYSVATTNEIAIVNGNPIDMYPLDHGFPHIHMVSVDAPRFTIAKYRIDRFALMEGVPVFNRVMEQWILLHRGALLASWERCQAGHHPFKVN